MQHHIIKTENYLLVVDESEITKGNWHLKNDVMITRGHLIDENCKKIIAHLPLNGSPILEGVDLLPPLEDDVDVEKMAHAAAGYAKHEGDREKFYIKGYNKAKEKYKYTEEDLRKAWNTAYIDAMSIDEETYKPLFYEDFIQSLSQPKTPIGFECEASKSKPVFNGEPKTISNFVGFTTWTWEGKYIYE